MTETLLAFDRVLMLVRVAVFALAAICFVLFALDWLIRTRRISPFGRFARSVREITDPLVRPVEQRVVRAGGLPSSAPWWTLAAVVVGGILLITLLTFLRSQVVVVSFAAGGGARGLLRLVISWVIGILQLALIIRVIASWLRLGEYRWWIRWTVVLTDWFVRPLRRVIPPIGMVDITPLVAYLLLIVARAILLGMM